LFEIIRARDAEKILGSSKHLDKGIVYIILEPFLRNGLLTSNGEKWHNRRRMLTPAFHSNIMKEFFEVFKEESDKLISKITNRIDEEIDMIEVSSNFTFNAVCGNISTYP